ncbi:UNVERIFIED_ORG: hypothetical protein GGR68_002492 [Xanthomonas campestris]
MLASMSIRCTPTRRSVPARDEALSVTPRRAQARSYEQQATGSFIRDTFAMSGRC